MSFGFAQVTVDSLKVLFWNVPLDCTFKYLKEINIFKLLTDCRFFLRTHNLVDYNDLHFFRFFWFFGGVPDFDLYWKKVWFRPDIYRKSPWLTKIKYLSISRSPTEADCCVLQLGRWGVRLVRLHGVGGGKVNGPLLPPPHLSVQVKEYGLFGSMEWVEVRWMVLFFHPHTCQYKLRSTACSGGWG